MYVLYVHSLFVYEFKSKLGQLFAQSIARLRTECATPAIIEKPAKYFPFFFLNCHSEISYKTVKKHMLFSTDFI